ncbi:DUF5694 domain-containing protein [Chryseobacterium gotjawalense]|uniref:DUF5694 domain-containing protein n=1 Tax=Chryseobacterium gotjawalense TaxID=3042315 RepID=A0ABY8RDJ4_9FLAO|nr:DUF5694 domain-containing protein [Chryseobacterium sp. wdc7]WHF51584.1 DUF5694 domain-containing protein [Chryseobacterium sp. wdc7]
MKKSLLIFGILICNLIFAQKVKVLNFGTFHMAYTPDAHSYKFDAKDQKNINETYEIAKMIAKFKPTIICIEKVPNETYKLNNDYSNFLKNKDYKTFYGGEIALIAYQVGKIAGVNKLYAIDEQEISYYNFNIGNQLKNQVDSLSEKKFNAEIFKEFDEIEKLSTLQKLKRINTKKYLDQNININADNLTYVSTKGNFEGADEASVFYHRNLRIFSNLNQIPVTKDDRIFIIMGAAHTAFLNEFMKRSPKYELVDVKKYLK